jgi:general secretion pathway protein D
VAKDITDLTKGLALGATINLLKNNQAIDIVSEPSLLCINNKESSIYVGETKSFQTGATSTTTSADTTNITFKREDIGLTLKVKPRISTDNKVTLEISVVLEDAKELQDGQTNPDTSKKDIKTTAIVNNGEAIILGGYIKNTTDHIEDKVPFFGDIPILGTLFKNNKEVHNRINLVIIITPYIVSSSGDLTELRTQLSELKILEDKYAKDLLIRLEKRKLEIQKDTVNRKRAIASIKAEQKEFEEDNYQYIEKTSSTHIKTDYTSIHNQRVQEILGN